MSNNVVKVTGDEWAHIFFKLERIDGVKSLYRCVQCHPGSQLYTCAKVVLSSSQFESGVVKLQSNREDD